MSSVVPPATRAAVRLSQPGDASEQQATRMAEEAIHHRASDQTPGARSAAGAGGEPLPDHIRARLEPAFGANLGDVRLHVGPEAADAARAVSARAFTVGGDVAFGAQEYQPGTIAGQKLIAHEVAHTLQAPSEPVVHRTPDGESPTPPVTTTLPDSLRLSYADFLRLETRRREPILRWLDTNADRLQLLSTCALTGRVRQAVPEASGFADLEIESILDEWAQAHGLTIPRLSATPERCDTIPAAATGPSVTDRLGDTELGGIVRRAISLAVDGIDVSRDRHGRFNISASGARIELRRGIVTVAGILGFTGGYSVEADAGPFHFRASLDQDTWRMSLSFGTELPARLNARLERVFTEAEASMRRIIASVSTADPAQAKRAIEQEMQRVKDAVDALSRAAALAGPRVSIGVDAGGPSFRPGGPSAPPTSVELTLSVWF